MQQLILDCARYGDNLLDTVLKKSPLPGIDREPPAYRVPDYREMQSFRRGDDKRQRMIIGQHRVNMMFSEKSSQLIDDGKPGPQSRQENGRRTRTRQDVRIHAERRCLARKLAISRRDKMQRIAPMIQGTHQV